MNTNQEVWTEDKDGKDSHGLNPRQPMSFSFVLIRIHSWFVPYLGNRIVSVA